jgi:tRNA synthetases class I (R)
MRVRVPSGALTQGTATTLRFALPDSAPVISQDFTDPATNILDWVESLTDSSFSAEVPYTPEGFDVVLVGPEASRRKQEHMALVEEMTIIDRDGSSTVRVPDSRIAALGASLEDGVADPFYTRQLARGDQWLVNFASSNASKALHIGHLRNVAVGHAIASLAESAGASVLRQSRIGDYGRNMGEAVAGYAELAATDAPGRGSEKSDHFVGRCYALYAARTSKENSSDGDANVALKRERFVADDIAEKYLRCWRDRDPKVVGLFGRIRQWGVTGQYETLAKLGISMDRTLFESDFLDEATVLIEAALSRGIVERATTGAIVYPTGDEQYPQLLLTRADGFPTQHLRYIATWRAIGAGLSGVHTVGVIGSEWEPLAKYTEQILSALADRDDHMHPRVSVIHGMVTGGKKEMHSSTGEAVLIDDLLTDLSVYPEIRALQAQNERCDLNRVITMALLGFFLGKPIKKQMPFASQQLVDTKQNAGWAIAQAWASAWRPEYDGPPDPEPADADYRFVVVRSQGHRRLMLQCLHNMELFPLTRYLFHLSSWFIGLTPSPRVARAMRTVLQEGLEALGLGTTPRVPG